MEVRAQIDINMNLIIPMAGKGKRLRPQTLITPKPLVEVAGKTIIQRIVDLVQRESKVQIKNIGFIIEKPDSEIEKLLKVVSNKTKTPHQVFYQGKALGTAHAIYCAKKLLQGPVFIVFSDTLFETELNFTHECNDGYIFVKEVDDPSAYGVVKTNPRGHIIEFEEKPINSTSNLAMVGMYYFVEGATLAREIKLLLHEKKMEKGEYQLTTVLEALKNKNEKFVPKKVTSWLDFGNKK